MAWKASVAHRIGENEKNDNDNIKKSVPTSSACGLTVHSVIPINVQLRSKGFDSMYLRCMPKVCVI